MLLNLVKDIDEMRCMFVPCRLLIKTGGRPIQVCWTVGRVLGKKALTNQPQSHFTRELAQLSERKGNTKGWNLNREVETGTTQSPLNSDVTGIDRPWIIL